MKTDKETGAAENISVVHYQIHQGWHFTGSYTGTIGANTAMRSIFATSTNEAHALFEFQATGPIEAVLYETPTATTDTGASTIILYNNDRASANTTICRFRAFTVGSIGTTVGTRIESDIGNAGLVATVGGAVGDRAEWILAANKSYLLEVNNKNAALTSNCCVNVYYYEKPTA